MGKAIYLDLDEEITSIIDRVKKSQEDRIVFIVPSGALVFQSLVNLRLLKKISDELQKKIVLVTNDKIGKSLAVQLGFEVSADQKNYEIERQKEELPQASAVVSEAIMAEPEFSMAELVAKKQMPFGENNKDEKVEGREFSVGREGRRKHSLFRKLSFLKKRISAISSKDKTSFLQKPKGKVLKMFAGVGGLAGIVALFVLFLVLPAAHITIRLQTSAFSYKTQLVVSTRAEVSDEDQKIIIGRLYEQTKTESVSVKTTGKKNLGEYARGTITVINKTSTTQSLMASTQFSAPDGKIFRSDSYVVVNGNSSSNVSVTASEAGEGYNIGPAHFIIIKLHPSVYDYIYGESTSAFSGGTDRIVPYVTEEDYNSAKQKAADTVASLAKKQLTDKIPNDKVFPPEAFASEILEASVAQEIGAEVSEMTVSISAKVSVIAYVREDYERVANLQLSALLSSETKIVAANLLKAKKTVLDFDVKNGKYTLVTEGEATISRTFDEDKLKSNIIGKTTREAESYLTSQALVDDVRIEYWPFWVSRMPIQDTRIYLKYEYK